MKKVLIYFAILIILLFPVKVRGISAQISGASIDGGNIANVGKEFIQSFKVKFSDIKKGTIDTLGIWLVNFELDYDENVFIVESISTDGNEWDSIVYKEDNKTYVLSEFSNDVYKNACVDKTLYCADYLVSIKFYVKDIDKQSTEIKMKDISAGAFKVSGDINPEYTTDNMIELNYSSVVTNKISINKPANVEINEPKDITSSTKPTIKTPEVDNTTNNKTENYKSNNNYLKTLEIKNYKIDFSKEKLNYNITIEDEVNELVIDAVSDDDNATIEIIGNDNLKENDYKVLIKVKALNDDEKVYTIKCSFLTRKENKKEKNILKKEFKLDKKTKNLTIVGAIVVILIILGIIVYNIISNKKIDKKLDL